MKQLLGIHRNNTINKNQYCGDDKPGGKKPREGTFSTATSYCLADVNNLRQIGLNIYQWKHFIPGPSKNFLALSMFCPQATVPFPAKYLTVICSKCNRVRLIWKKLESQQLWNLTLPLTNLSYCYKILPVSFLEMY